MEKEIIQAIDTYLKENNIKQVTREVIENVKKSLNIK